ncbi:hypothetical protein [Paenibacillus sp. FSL H7-0331]|uniref:hypothetical protein n=1 Tax=Paenibacillus sp. FSL H7-0331 TaxID=1920421 RepID=UPI0015C323C1|nr:hypothetical protein [Paenibacillus sp. FSL H7-0331]
MQKRENDVPHYFDGSDLTEFADEIAEGVQAGLQEKTVNQEEWRGFISANPFGDHRNA